MPLPRNTPKHQPIRLKTTLRVHAIRQRDLAEVIVQASGKPLTRVALNILLNRGVWPVTTPETEIRTRTEALLREHGVDEAEIATIWQAEDHDMPHGQAQHYRTGGVPFTPRHHPATPDQEPVEMLTDAAKRYFRLFSDPFRNDVGRASDVFLAPDQRYVREAMYATARHGGFMAIVGESGSGKTTLFNDLYDRIDSEQAKIIVASPSVVDVDLASLTTRLTARRILEALLAAVSSEVPRASMERLTRQVREALANVTRGESGHTVTLMIEEAHSLTPGTLKSLKRLLEISQGHRQLFSVILIGQPELMDLLNEARHPELREVIRRCEVATLSPLDANLEAYVAHKFKRINADPAAILAPDAYDALRTRLVNRSSKGAVSMLYPLVVNNWVTRAMNAAASLGAPIIDADVIRSL